MALTGQTTDSTTNGTGDSTSPVNPNLQAILDGVQAVVASAPALIQVAATCQMEVMKTELQVLEHKMAFLEKTAGTIPEDVKFSILVGEVFPGSRHVDLPPAPVEGESEVTTAARRATELIKAVNDSYGDERKAAYAICRHFGINLPEDEE